MRHPGMPPSSSSVESATDASVYDAAHVCDGDLCVYAASIYHVGPPSGVVNLLKGRTSINQIVDAALKRGMPVFGVTDVYRR
jgi:hypothetical protein